MKGEVLMILKYFWYFIIGGIVVTFSIFFGSKGQGIWAAFVTQFPSISVLAFYFIYKEGGNLSVIKYAKGFFYTLPPWIVYILFVAFLCDKIGPLWSLFIGVGLYSVITLILIYVFHI